MTAYININYIPILCPYHMQKETYAEISSISLIIILELNFFSLYNRVERMNHLIVLRRYVYEFGD